MSEKIWQCCYTNAEKNIGGVLETGWSEVAVSEGIPSDALGSCASYQGTNSRIKEQKDIFEVFGDGKYVYIMKSFYGLLDYAGRPNMFSHGYILEWDDVILKNPNIFINIADSNFTSSVEEAEKKKDALQAIKKDADFLLKDVLNELGIENNNYAKLIKSIYIQYTENRIFKPLYVQYDGNIETMKKLLYCIYIGLPFYIRKNIKAASLEGNNANRTNIIFSKEAYKYSSYIAPKTGENNILAERENLRLKKLRFVDYAVENLEDEISINEFFATLESMAALCGNDADNDEKLYSLAYFINGYEDLRELKTDEINNLTDIIFDKADTKSDRVQELLSDFLQILKDRKEGFYSDIEEKIIRLLEGDVLKVLTDSARGYFIYRLTSLPPKGALSLFSKFNKTDAESYKEFIPENVQSESESISADTEVQENVSAARKESEPDKVTTDEEKEESGFEERGTDNEEKELSERMKPYIDKILSDFSAYSHSEIIDEINKIFESLSDEESEPVAEKQEDAAETGDLPKGFDALEDDNDDAAGHTEGEERDEAFKSKKDLSEETNIEKEKNTPEEENKRVKEGKNKKRAKKEKRNVFGLFKR